VSYVTYPEKILQNNVTVPFLLLSVVTVTLPRFTRVRSIKNEQKENNISVYLVTNDKHID